jgi:hypothetical protein
MRSLIVTLFFLPALWASAINLTVSPNSVKWTDQGWINLSITNVAEAAGVDISLYLDINGDGIVNGSDYAVAVFEVEDGQFDPFGSVVYVDDNDGLTNGAVETAISCHGISYSTLHTIGHYIWQAVEVDESGNPVGSDSAPFAVTQPASDVWITGEVRDYVSNELKPGAYVETGYFSDTTGLAPSVWTDENGEFTLYIPDGIPASEVIGVRASVKGMLSADINPYTGEAVSTHFFTNALFSGENALEQPLFTAPAVEAYELYDVSGTVYLVSPTDEGFETNLLRGVMVETGSDETWSWDITDENGQFSLVSPPTGGDESMELWCESPLLNLRGILGTYTEVEVTNTVSGVEIYCRRAEAIARAQVTDKETGEPLEGVEVYFESTDGSRLVSGGYTLSDGFYEIGVAAGTWWAECDEDSLGYRHYLCPAGSNDLEIAEYSIFTNAPFGAERGCIISGHVYDTNGTPLALGSVVLIQQDPGGWENWITDADTSLSGGYDLLSPTGTVYLRTEDFGDYVVNAYYTNHFTADLNEADPLTVTTNGLTGIDFFLPYGARIEGSVLNPNSNSVSWLSVEALAQNESGEWVCVGAGSSDWGGDFGFAVLGGSNVMIRTGIDYGSWYPRTWYGDTCSQNLATPLVLTNHTTVSNLNIQVFPGYLVYGDVCDQNGLSGISGATVTAFDASSNRYDSVITDGSGHYASLFVPTNVGLAFYAGAAGYQGEFYDNVYNPAEATGIQNSAYDPTSVSFTLYATGTDSDNDGLADYKEDSVPDGVYTAGTDYANYSNPDTDNDGFNDGNEYVAGTNPQNSGSLFEIIGGEVQPSAAILVWSSVAGRQYQVQFRTNLLSGVWDSIYTVTATGITTTFTNSFPGGREFYRVRVQAP